MHHVNRPTKRHWFWTVVEAAIAWRFGEALWVILVNCLQLTIAFVLFLGMLAVLYLKFGTLGQV